MTHAIASIEPDTVDRVGNPEPPLRWLERRFSGRFTVDPFGLDPQLADLVRPLFTFAMRVQVDGEQNVPLCTMAFIAPSHGQHVETCHRRFRGNTFLEQ